MQAVRARQVGTGHAPPRHQQQQEPAKAPNKGGKKPGSGADSGGQGEGGRGGGGAGGGDWVRGGSKGGGSSRGGGGGGKQPRGNKDGGGGGGGPGKGGGGKENSGGGAGGGKQGSGNGGGARAGRAHGGARPPQSHATRPTPEQLALNKTLSSLDNPVAVLEALQGASDKGIQINATNLTTGIHRIASRGGGNKPNLLRNPWLGALLNLIFKRVQENGSEFSSRELSTVAWALGKLAFKVDLVFAELRSECDRRGFGGFNWHDLSNMAWAHAVTPGRGKMWESCMMQLAREGESRPLAGIAPQALSNLAWALATLGLSYGGNSAQALLEKLADHALSIGVGAFKPQEVSAMLWAFAVGGIKAPGLFARVEEDVVGKMLEGYNAQKMSTLACAFAQTGNKATALFDLLEEALVERAMANFNPANTATIAWAFASAGHSTEEVLSVCEERVWQLGLQGFGDVHLVLLVWALGASSYRGPGDAMARDTLNMVEVELRKRKLRDMPESHLATLTWAFRRQGHPGGGGLLRVQKELLSRGWVQPDGKEDGAFSWSLASRSRSLRDKTPKTPKLMRRPSGSGGGLMGLGYGPGAQVKVGGGCWAVEGAEDALHPREAEEKEAGERQADSFLPAAVEEEDSERSMFTPVGGPAVKAATWTRPVPKA